MRLFDSSGRDYLDLVASGGMGLLGWQPRAVVDAATRALAESCYAPPDWELPVRTQLIGRLVELCAAHGADVVQATTGTEAVEAALRIARNATGRTRFAYLDGAYHGSSVAAAALCGIDGWMTATDELGFGNLRLSVGTDPEPIDSVVSPRQADELAAVVIEPSQANAGYRSLSPAWMQALRRFCDVNDVLLISDEVNGSFGRTGTWLSGARFDLRPDILIVGKGMSGGVYPIAALLVRAGLAELAHRPGFGPSSFAWAPPGCAAALATIEFIEREGLVERAVWLRSAVDVELRSIERHPLVSGITGDGLAVGIGLDDRGDGPPLRLRVRQRLLEAGFVVGANPNLGLVLTPALTIAEADLRLGLVAVAEALDASTCRPA